MAFTRISDDSSSPGLSRARSLRRSIAGTLCACSLLIAACSSGNSDGGSSGGAGGTASGGASRGGNAGQHTGGSSASGGNSNRGGSAGQGGSANSSGGSAGSNAGSAGDSGSAGEGGSAGSNGGDGGAGGSAGSGGSAGHGGGSGGADPRPILERPAQHQHACTIAAPLEKLGLDPWFGGTLGKTAAGVFLLYGAGEQGNARAVLARIDADGKRSEEVELGSTEANWVTAPELVERDGGLAALWLVSDDDAVSKFQFATVDVDGKVASAAKSIDGIAGNLSQGKLAKLETGYALLYTVVSDDYSSNIAKVALLDESGIVAGTPKTLGSGAPYGEALGIQALPNGFAVTYGERDDQGQSQLYLAFFDEAANAKGTPVPLGAQSQFASYSQSTLLHGDELVVAFTMHSGGFENEDIAVTLQLAKFDVATRELRLQAALQAPQQDVQNIDPRLVALGDDIGLVWSQGGVIYICAGCTPDNHLQFVVLDANDFDPLSDVTVLENQLSRGGYIRPSLAPLGDALLLSSTLEYHVSGEGAFAALHCEQGQ